jgi:hypothetical protein
MTGLLIACLLASACSGIYDTTFSEAAGLYEQGRYVESARRFSQLVREGVEHPAVFYNLGNARYRAGDLAGAIVEYERAMRLDPSMDGLRQNLAQCVSETRRPLDRPRPPAWEQSFFFWHAGLAARTVRLAGLVVWGLFWLVLAVRYARPFAWSGALALLLLAVALACGASAFVKARPSPLLVAHADVVPVYHGTSENDTVRFELYLGDRVASDSSKEGWVRVTAAGGERGWARADSFVPVGPPYRDPPGAANDTGQGKARQ